MSNSPRATKSPRSTERTEQPQTTNGSNPDDIAPLSARYTLDPEHLYDEVLDNSESNIGDFLTTEDTHQLNPSVPPPPSSAQRPVVVLSAPKPPRIKQTSPRSTKPLLFIVILILVLLLPKLIFDYIGSRAPEKSVGGFAQAERERRNKKSSKAPRGPSQQARKKQATNAPPAMSIALSRVPLPKSRPTTRKTNGQFYPLSKLGKLPGNTATYVSGGNCSNLAAAPFYLTLLQVKDPGFRTFHLGFFKKGSNQVKCKLRYHGDDGRVAEGGSCARAKGYREIFYEPTTTKTFSEIKIDFANVTDVNRRHTIRFRRCF